MLTRLKKSDPKSLCVSTITTTEIEYGLRWNPARGKKIAPVVAALLGAIRTLPFSESDARTAAAIRTELRLRGTRIGAYDVLLAGCAMSRGLIMVTSNLHEFRRVSGLRTEDWGSTISTPQPLV